MRTASAWRFVAAEASAGADEVDEAVVALRQAAADVGVELLELRVHAVRAEALAQLDHRGRARVVEQLVDHHHVTGHGRRGYRPPVFRF